MNRRIMLKNLALFSGSVLFLPSCLQSHEKKASVTLRHLQVTAGQEALLAEVAEAIIPATDSPGARALGLPGFVWMMVDDCYDKKAQQDFLKGLDQLEAMSQNNFRNAFTACSAEEREQLLQQVESNDAEPAVLAFYGIVKKEVIRGYLNSKLVMTRYRKYEMAPGRYDGYFPVAAKS